MDLALNNLQRLICHEKQTNKQTNKQTVTKSEITKTEFENEMEMFITLTKYNTHQKRNED